MSSTSTSRSDFASIFNAALESYKHKTKDLASHPLLSRLRSCDSPEAVLTVLRDQIPAFNQSQNREDRLTKWAFPPANAIFAVIRVLLLVAKDAGASQDKLIDIFNRIERFSHRLETYTGITPTTTAMKGMIVEIMVEVLTILMDLGDRPGAPAEVQQRVMLRSRL
ncbi:hypothetical protein F5888DRAFT_1909208 [Russula emetica]|nr:hypothetical protein F5888DRAFT_1909208 [Russula emetica]